MVAKVWKRKHDDPSSSRLATTPWRRREPSASSRRSASSGSQNNYVSTGTVRTVRMYSVYRIAYRLQYVVLRSSHLRVLGNWHGSLETRHCQMFGAVDRAFTILDAEYSIQIHRICSRDPGFIHIHVLNSRPGGWWLEPWMEDGWTYTATHVLV